MKTRLLIILLALLIASLGAIDDRYLHQLAHLKNIKPYQVNVGDEQVVLSDQNDLWIYTMFNAWQPRLEGVFHSVYKIEDVNVMGRDQLFICSQEAANVITSVDTLSTPGRIYFTNLIIGDKMTREGSILFVADRFRGIDIIDIGKGGLKNRESTFSEKWGIRSFIAESPYLYALNDFGLVTVDISDRSYPISLGTNYEIVDAQVMAKNGNILWIGAGKRLLAISIMDLARPKLINQFRLSNDIQDLELKDDRLFIALGKGGVKILDVANPFEIKDLNTIYPSAMQVYDIALDKDYVFLALGKDGWMIYEYR